MSNFLLSHQALLNICIINAILALSQYVVLRAGVFSLATAGIAAIGAYTAGILMLRGVHPAVCVLAAAVTGIVAAVILSVPLARLRGVFQAIATLAFVQIVMSLALYAESITGGATGLNGIAKTVETWHLLAVLLLVVFVMSRLGRSPTGRAFDTIRQDETVAVSLGIDVVSHHRVAFILSGCIAGLGGGMMAGHNYSVATAEFGFHLRQECGFLVHGIDHGDAHVRMRLLRPDRQNLSGNLGLGSVLDRAFRLIGGLVD